MRNKQPLKPLMRIPFAILVHKAAVAHEPCSANAQRTRAHTHRHMYNKRNNKRAMNRHHKNNKPTAVREHQVPLPQPKLRAAGLPLSLSARNAIC